MGDIAGGRANRQSHLEFKWCWVLGAIGFDKHMHLNSEHIITYVRASGFHVSS